MIHNTHGGAIMILNSHKVKLLLAELGLTQTKLAEKSGISRQNISNILAKGRCSPATAGKIAAGLGVQVGEIVEER
jgi:DNA-binding XRE family transcriptional regulator